MFLHVSICSQGGEGICLRSDGLPLGGGSAYGGGVGVGHTPLGTRKAGGTHPTGMFSCFILQLCITMDVASVVKRS